jgi:hypothetical protein
MSDETVAGRVECKMQKMSMVGKLQQHVPFGLVLTCLCDKSKLPPTKLLPYKMYTKARVEVRNAVEGVVARNGHDGFKFHLSEPTALAAFLECRSHLYIVDSRHDRDTHCQLVLLLLFSLSLSLSCNSL